MVRSPSLVEGQLLVALPRDEPRNGAAHGQGEQRRDRDQQQRRPARVGQRFRFRCAGATLRGARRGARGGAGARRGTRRRGTRSGNATGAATVGEATGTAIGSAAGSAARSTRSTRSTRSAIRLAGCGLTRSRLTRSRLTGGRLAIRRLTGGRLACGWLAGCGLTGCGLACGWLTGCGLTGCGLACGRLAVRTLSTARAVRVLVHGVTPGRTAGDVAPVVQRVVTGLSPARLRSRGVGTAAAAFSAARPALIVIRSRITLAAR